MATDNGVHRRDTTKGPPLRILSLDGGGVRGYSMLILLQELMHRTFVETEGRAPRRSEIPKPCEHFDLIAGTGTGGLIAIMLGRLRLDVETCKDVYVRMTKRVFETDKTIVGIPYRSTLFKASKLEEAIRDCVREHTIFAGEGNDTDEAPTSPIDTPTSAGSIRPNSVMYGHPQRSMSSASRYSLIGQTPISYRGSLSSMRFGNPNALLYDNREDRTKTAVTAVYKGTNPQTGGSILLRSYDSRKESRVEPEVTIWQAGRATAATMLAFKPIQVGQSVFLDEGAAKYNPSPQILDEAMMNEWPGREVGLFLSIGTGKRKKTGSEPEHLWFEGLLGGSMGDFAEARRRLIHKIDGCEETHQYMLRQHLSDRRVNPENYYRLNVEVGVGEFGMNEWGRLADISTNTRRYLARDEVQHINYNAASKLARIHLAKQRVEHHIAGSPDPASKWNLPPQQQQVTIAPPADPLAVELPAEDVIAPLHIVHKPQRQSDLLSPHYHRRPSEDEKMMVLPSDDFPTPLSVDSAQFPNSTQIPFRPSSESHRPMTNATGAVSPYGHSPAVSINSIHSQPRWSGEDQMEPPPLPPKTPIPGHAAPAGGMQSHLTRPPGGAILPYPDNDGPPPSVNMARKPNLNAH